MQSELPWNVAGIPPEAREAARAAARREGLSVGEWMTRRILRGFPEASAEERAAWRPTLVEPPPLQPESIHSPRESEEMLERVSRSEVEAQNAYKVLDQQLRTVARRLETAERNQTENNRAMNQAASQINIAAREQAQAFEQMSTNVGALAERLVRVERHAQNDNTREAVKALHEGLSRLADQIAQTANQSAAQIAALAGNVDSLATQSAETREATDATAQAVEARFASLDERLRVVERTAVSSASAIDHTMENVEALRAAKDALEAELHQQLTLVAKVQDSFEQFSAQSSIDDSARAEAITRLEERVSDLQAQNSENPLDRRLEGIEHVLGDIMSRLEQAERTSSATGGTVEQTLRELALSFESADQNSRENIRELQSAMQETAAKIAAVEQKLTPPPQPQPAEPILDMPRFPQDASPYAEANHDYAASHDAMPDFAPYPESPDPFAPHPDAAIGFAPPPFAETAPSVLDEPFGSASPEPLAGESFLSAARRAANDAAANTAEASPRAAMGGFAWTFSGNGKQAQSDKQGKRYLMAGSIFGIAVAAALGGVVLTRGVGSTEPHAMPSASIGSPFAARPSLAPTKGSDEGGVQPDVGSEPQASLAPSPKRAAAPHDAAPGPSAAPTAKPLAAAPHATSVDASARLIAPSPTQAAPAPQAQSASASPVQRVVALAKSGDAKGQLLLGLRYLEGNGVTINEAEAARWLARAAQQGEPLAQYRLGTLYERGRGVAADAKLASHWYELAAKQGNRKAMHNLAVSFAEGSGEPKDPVQAALWFSRAASLGLADSQFNLAVLYERGMGVKQSLMDAYKWYLIAAAQGDAESKTRAEALATQLSNADRAAAQQAAAAFRPQALNPAANSAPAFG